LKDVKEPENEDFEDWINQVNGFMHMISTPSIQPTDQLPILIYVSGLVGSVPNIDEMTGQSVNNIPSDESYVIVLQSETAHKADKCVVKVQNWHKMLQRPDEMSDADYGMFLRYCTEFFLSSKQLWWKSPKGEHKLVVKPSKRLFILTSAHDDIRHHGFFATHVLILIQYWWPYMSDNVAWFVTTCRICQLRKTQNILILPVVATPAPLFAKIYVDTMYLPPSNSYKFLVQGHCSLVHWAEFKMLRRETARAIAK